MASVRGGSRHSSSNAVKSNNSRDSDYRRSGGGDRRGDRERTPTREKRERSRERSPLNRSSNRNEEMSESGKKKFASRCRLFVGNLSNDVKETDLRDIFKKYGDVMECFMSGKGFGFVRLDTRAHAELAKENLDGFTLKSRCIRVRYAVHGASVKVKELSPFVSNELLAQAFSMFGDVERAVHILDERSQPTGEGIVEFERKPGAVDALRRINEGIFLLTSNPRPALVEPLDPRDDEDGLSERMLPKNNLYQRERSQLPRFAAPGSFEFEFGNRWKELYQLERVKKDQLERELKEARERLENEMELAYQEYQTAQLREDLKRRQEELERLEASRRDRMEMLRMRDEERSRNRPTQAQQGFQLMGGNFQNPNFPGNQNLNSMMHGNDNVRAPARTEEQLAHGVQKLMQMMQNNNQARGGLSNAGMFPPMSLQQSLEMQQAGGGMPLAHQQAQIPPEFFESRQQPSGGFRGEGGRGRGNNMRRHR